MIRTMLGILTVALGVVSGQGALAERDSAKVYIFGNSLVHHLSKESENTNVPYWLNALAKTGGQTFGVDGQWGFMRNFADGLPPTSNWGFKGVSGVWNTNAGSFGQSGYDAVIMTPANFIQYQQPDIPYDGENPDHISPLTAMLQVFDWVAEENPNIQLMVYEGWSDMARFGRFPPDRRALHKYHAHNAGDYHAWFQDLVSKANTARPDMQVQLIPVASTLAKLMGKGGILQNVPPEALYEDDAPHGTPETYFLAAMITYSALYQAPPPADFQVPAGMHPEIASKYSQIAQVIWDATPRIEARAAVSIQSDQGSSGVLDLPKRADVDLPPQDVRPTGIPAMGFGLNGVSDWSTQQPFVDIMKTSRGWVGHIGDDWGGFSTEQLVAGGYLSDTGWPLRLPDGVDALEAVFLTSQSEGSNSLRGDYVLMYKGKGRIRMMGAARRTRYEDGRIEFYYEPGGPGSLVGIKIDALDESDPIRDIHVVRKNRMALYEAGAIFNPEWIEVVQDVRSVRFMDWMLTNGSPVSTWDERPRMEDGTWTQWGVPLEVMIRLANKIGADPWFNMPHRADDDYVRRFAQMVKRDLDPDLKVYVEYSNEVWNRVFPQARWAQENATRMWGETAHGWMQFYGMRAAEIMDIWTEVYGDRAKDSLIRTVATHTGWAGLEDHILFSPLGYLKAGKTPIDSFDAYAITGYFGFEMGSSEMKHRVDGWLDRSEAQAEKEGKDKGLRRVALREYVKKHRFEGAVTPITETLSNGSLKELTDQVFPYHAGVAARNDLRLLMYEGGTHVSGHGEQVQDQRLTDFFTYYNYTPEMAKLYEQLLNGWTNAGGVLFNAFVDVASASQWGSWGAKRYLEDQNPRWDMLMAFNAVGPNDWEERDLKTFNNGITRIAGAGNQRLQGTGAEDVLIAGSGNDTLVSSGGDDILHGGAGRDRAVLPGAQSDFTFAREQGRLIATGPKGRVTMAGIEQIAFESAPEVTVNADTL
jgi:hypothetical protein